MEKLGTVTSEFRLHPFRSLRDDAPPAADLADLLAGCHPGRYLETQAARSLVCRPPLWLDHDEAERRFFFGGRAPDAFDATYRFPAAHLAAFPNAWLAGQGCVVVAGDGRVLTDSFSSDAILELGGRFQKRVLRAELDGQQHSLPFALGRPRGQARSLPERCLLATQYWHFNYHHWLVECLPRLRHALETPELADCRVIVPANMAPFQRESLALLGLESDRLLPFDGGDWRIDLLLFASIGRFAPEELAWLRERLAAGVAGSSRAGAPAPEREGVPGPAPARPSRLYISRADASMRRLTNEAEVVAALQAFGFELLTLTGMPLAEQIARFAAAEIILGPHGSGLTNLLFAPRQATIIELMPRDQVNHCFWLMAEGLGLPYTFLSGEPVSPERDFAIPVPRLRALVEALLAGRV